MSAGGSICRHLDQIEVTELPDKIDGCEECLKIGSGWVHLRMCMTCGKMGCCDSSPNKHATTHERESGHRTQDEEGDDPAPLARVEQHALWPSLTPWGRHPRDSALAGCARRSRHGNVG